MDVFSSIYNELKPGGFVLLLLLAVGTFGWSWAFWWLWAVRGCTASDRSTLQNWIRECNSSSSPEPLNEHRIGLLHTLVEPFQRGRMFHNSKMRELLDTAVSASRNRYRSGIRLIGVSSAALPLLGLFGTLVGIIRSFDALALFGTGNIQLLSDGIAQALITTQAGLLLAVPLVFLYRYMKARVERHTKNMELVAHCLLRHRNAIPALVKQMSNG